MTGLEQKDRRDTPAGVKESRKGIGKFSKSRFHLPWGQHARDESSQASNSASNLGTISAPKPMASSSSVVTSSNVSLSETSLHQNHSEKPSGTFKPICELWNEAYDDLHAKEETQTLVKEYEALLSKYLATLSEKSGAESLKKLLTSEIGRKKQMEIILRSKVEEVNRNTWKLKFGGSDVAVRDMTKSITSTINWLNQYVSDAVSVSPYASVAWVGVSLLLPLLLNPSKQMASFANSIEYISSLVIQSSMREELYRRRYEIACIERESERPDLFLEAHSGYRNSLKEVYVQILKFQATVVCYCSKTGALRVALDMVKWNDWETLLATVKDKEASFSAINEDWKDMKYEEECIIFKKHHQESMHTLNALTSDLSSLRKAVEGAQKDSHRTELLDWLSSIDPSENYNSARALHEEETGDWLVRNNKDFETWEISPNSLLWLHGKAGSGKSVLSSSIIKHLKDGHDQDPQTALAFFYYSFNDTKKQNPVEMLRSLIKQLCCRRPDTPQAVQDLASCKEKGHHPDMETLETTLIATIQGFEQVYMVIDALDECPFANGTRKMLLDILRRIHNTDSSNLHILCTSRKENDIDNFFTPLLVLPHNTAIDLSKNIGPMNQDIRLYVDKTLVSYTWPESVKNEARETLIQKADGMFQYVSCQFQDLSSLSSVGMIRKALQNLPEGLDATYMRILQNIDLKFQSQVASSLKWLAFSLRPLTLSELSEIFILDREQAVPFNKENRLFSPKDVLKYFSGLVSLSSDVDSDMDSDMYSLVDSVLDSDIESDDSIIVNARDEVKLAHFSIKEYLVSDRIRGSPVALFSVEETEAHLHISASCLVYHLQISAIELATRESVERYLLWGYAALGWVNHLEKVDRELWPPSIIQNAVYALLSSKESMLCMVRIGGYIGFHEESHWDTEPGNVSSPLHYSASWNALGITELLIDNGAKLDAVSPNKETVLMKASIKGYKSIVELLLDRGADVNAQGGEYGSALQAAACSGNREFVQLLLERGADVNARGGKYGNALQAAARSGNREVVQLLLERGADVNAQGGEYGNALQAAARSGNREVVQLLLERGADVNAQGGEYRKALQAAARSGNREVVQLLLERGADVNAQGGKYGNALQAAACSGNREVVQLLLERGADVNAQGGEYGNALQAAAQSRSREVVQLLLERGADINAQGGEYGNALQAAIAFGESGMAELLVSRGAKPDTPRLE